MKQFDHNLKDKIPQREDSRPSKHGSVSPSGSSDLVPQCDRGAFRVASTQAVSPYSRPNSNKNDEILSKLLESLRNACLAMIDTIDAYREVTDKRGK